MPRQATPLTDTKIKSLKAKSERYCSGQVNSDTTIGFFTAMFCSKTDGGTLPNTEFSLSLL